MRIATAAIVTSVATVAIGGMLAFCRADERPAEIAKAVVDAKASAPASVGTTVASSPESQSANPTVRRWGDPAPETLPQASAIAAELAAIRERVGTAVPENWSAFGVAAAAVEEAGFERNVETLEAEAPPDWRSDLTVPTPIEFDAIPRLADSETDGDREIPFKASPYAPFPGEGGLGSIPNVLPNSESLPYESEALGELTKLLSATARDLERMAHIREEQRRYEDADRLRRLAVQLRRENRRLRPDPTPNPASPGSSVGGR